MNVSNTHFYLAPMEGVTGYIFRNAYHTFFHDIDQYYSPFIAANQNGKLKTREKQDILPEHNTGIHLIPQILTNNVDDFVRTVKELKAYGYQEVNLNLGCPSSTVTSKCKGSGFLGERQRLDQFLSEIFEQSDISISIKTRIGRDDPEEFYQLIEMYNQYPLKELIIHPRIMRDYYNNKPNLEIFSDAIKLSKHSLCYNGDIFTKEDYIEFQKQFPMVEHIMIGRGIVANPGLIHEIRTNEPMSKEKLLSFHDYIYQEYQKVMSGDTNVLYKMKELWFYMSCMFEDALKYNKKIRKCSHLSEYNNIIEQLFSENALCENRGFRPNLK